MKNTCKVTLRMCELQETFNFISFHDWSESASYVDKYGFFP